MPRARRIDIPGLPYHVVQRGNNRFHCFATPQGRAHALRCLGEAMGRYGCALHAYALMDNHVHLLMTPATPRALSNTMKRWSQNYSAWFNFTFGRTGTLWEGRFFSSPVDTDGYLLACYRYIELNPVRAGVVRQPGDFRWSSHRANAYGYVDPLVTPHAVLLALSREPEARRRHYRALFDDALPERLLTEIRTTLRRRAALGGEAFRELVATSS